MRFGVGLLVLGLGGVGLGWLTHASYAPYMQDVITERATAALGQTVHPVSLSVEGRDITVTGLADGPDERTRIVAALDAVAGRRVVNDDLDVLPVIDPFTLDATWDGTALTATGHAPTAAQAERISQAATATLTLAAGSPAGWTDAALAGMAAMAPLIDGQMRLEGQALTITGTARTPAEGAALTEALAALPAGYTPVTEITYLDDGTPPAYQVSFRPDTGVSVTGKLPMGLEASDIAAALNLGQIDDQATRSLVGDPQPVAPALAALAPWMRGLEGFDVSVAPDGNAAVALIGRGADAELIAEALGADLAASGAALEVAEAPVTAAEGATRVNVITGQTERLTAGYWLQVPGFAPSFEACTAETDAALAADRIGFVTGSARLDARAHSAVNTLAAIVLHCTTDTGLKAEIGGHTDSTGSAEGNMVLSQARAAAVLQALVARGVARPLLRAQGFGATQPIADNETEEGRTANRRTAVTWINE